MDGFHAKYSDIDFLACLREKPVSAKMTQIRRIHRQIQKQYPLWKLDGTYLFGNSPGTACHVHDAHPSVRVDAPPDPVSLWTLHHHGIAVLGSADVFGAAPSVDVLKQWTRANQRTYWLPWTRHPLRFAMLLSHWGVQWAVLGILRQYHTLREGSLTTKEGAGSYGLAHLPAEWHPLIMEALALRGDRQMRHRTNSFSRARHTVRFLQFVIDQCAGLV